MLKSVVDFILGLGPSVMLPIILTGFGMILGQGFKKSFRAGITIGVGFIGINLVVGLFFSALGPAIAGMVKDLGLTLDVMDVGWPIGAAISFGTPVAPLLIPIVLLVNVALLAVNFTKTMDVDLWNYWHFIFVGSVAYYATNSMLLGLLVGTVTAVIIFKLADWTAPVLDKHFGLPGISLPHTETVTWAPIAYLLDKVWDKIPGLNKWEADPETIQKRLGILGEPLMMGLVFGLLIGVGANYTKLGTGDGIKSVLTLGITLAAVMTLLPRMVAILMEGLIPLSEGARDFIQARFPGREVYIGLDAAIVIGHPAGMAVALLMVPISLVLAFILPYNRMLPLADIPVLPFAMIWAVAASRGNIIRGVLSGIVTMSMIFFLATEMSGLATTMGKAVGFNFPAGATAISGIDLGAHLMPWFLIKLVQPSDPYFVPAIIGLAAFAGIWWYVRNDIKERYSDESDKKAA